MSVEFRKEGKRKETCWLLNDVLPVQYDKKKRRRKEEEEKSYHKKTN